METWYKIDSSFPTAQFYMDSFTIYRRERNINGGGIILYIRDDIPSTLLNTETSTKGLYVKEQSVKSITVRILSKKMPALKTQLIHLALIYLLEIGQHVFKALSP